MKKEYREIIERAVEIIKPTNWCRKYWAINDQRRAVSYNSDEACQWCAEGYLLRAGKQLGHSHAVIVEAIGIVDDFVRVNYNKRSLLFYNDNEAKSSEDIRRLFVEVLDK